MEANVQLMEAFVPWANNQSWIERYFWNQAVSAVVILRCRLARYHLLGPEPICKQRHVCLCTEHASFSGSLLQQSVYFVVSML